MSYERQVGEDSIVFFNVHLDTLRKFVSFSVFAYLGVVCGGQRREHRRMSSVVLDCPLHRAPPRRKKVRAFVLCRLCSKKSWFLLHANVMLYPYGCSDMIGETDLCNFWKERRLAF